MRLSAVLCLFFLTILVVMGCRKPLKPNVDRNLAPETWITAAPQDTITDKNPDGSAIHLALIVHRVDVEGVLPRARELGRAEQEDAVRPSGEVVIGGLRPRQW